MPSFRSFVIGSLLFCLGMLCWVSAAANEIQGLTQPTEVMLVANAETDTIMLVSAEDGSLLDKEFISDTLNFSTPRQALLHTDQERILVVDQLADAIFAYDLEGNYLNVFAGQPQTNVIDNARSMTWHPNGNLLVTLGTSTSPYSQSVVQIAPDGEILGMFIRNNAGGIESPYDVLVRQNDLLVSDSGTDSVHRFDLSGVFQEIFAGPADRFPQQLTTNVSGSVLLSNFIGNDIGILEYDSTGSFIARHDDLTEQIVSYRGVQELNNGNLLVSTGVGVYEMTYGGNVVNTTVPAESSHYVERITGITDLSVQVEITPTMGVSPSVAILGEPLTMTFTISNTSQVTATGVQLDFDLPEGLQHISDDQSCVVIAEPDNTSSVVCDIGTIAPMANKKVIFVVEPVNPNTYALLAQVSRLELDAVIENDTVAFTIEVPSTGGVVYIPLIRK